MVTSLSLERNEWTFTAIGDTTQLEIVARDPSGAAVSTQAVTFTSSDPTVATVVVPGLVTAVGNGATVIDVRAGAVSTSAIITVQQIAARLTVSSDHSIFVALDDTVRLGMTALDANDHPITSVIATWTSSDPAVLDVDSTGLARAVANGATSITVAVDQTTATIEFAVEQRSTHLGLRVQPSGAAAGAPLHSQPVVEFRDANGYVVTNQTDAAVTAGLVGDVGELLGAQTVVAAAGIGIATFVDLRIDGPVSDYTLQFSSPDLDEVRAVTSGSFPVSPGAIAVITVFADEDTLRALGAEIQLRADAHDVSGNPVADARFRWASSDTGVASVTESGLVHAIGNGVASITATADNVTTGRAMAVSQAVDRVVVTPATAAAATMGAQVQFAASAADANDNSVGQAVFLWFSSNHNVAVVDTAGLVTATGEGDAIISASAEGVPGHAVLTAAIPVALVQLTPDTVRLMAGETAQLTVTVEDAGGTPLPDRPLTWASGDDQIARVSSDGIVTAVIEGTIAITATAEGVADTTTVVVDALVSALVASAIDALEDALFDAIGAFEEADDAGNTELATIDLFTFAEALTRFEAALAADPDNDVAAFGVAMTSLMTLEDNPDLRVAADQWEVVGNTVNDVIEITGGTGPFPPTFAEQQALLQTVVEPALLNALALLNTIDDPDFTFVITTPMQGGVPGLDDAELPARELDLTEVLALRAMVEGALAGIDIALSYDATPSPYGTANYEAALTSGSTFGTLTASAPTLLADAHARLIRAVGMLQDGLDALEAETDDQSDDLIKYDPRETQSWDDFDDFVSPMDLQDARDVLNDLSTSLAGRHTITRTQGVGEDADNLLQDVVVEIPRFFTNPIADLKTLLPPYDATAGEFFWLALAYDEWTLPDPSLNGILPNITTSDDFKDTFDAEDLWDEGAREIDEWHALVQSPVDGDVFTVTSSGAFHEMAADFTSGTVRPTVPTPQFSRPRLARNDVTNELLAFSQFDQELFTRPDDAATPWTSRIVLPSSVTSVVQAPAGDAWFATSNFGDLWEIDGALTVAVVRPAIFFDVVAMTANRQTGDLVTISQDGVMFSRPADAATPWTQRGTLQSEGFFGWVDIVQSPVDGDLFALNENGDVIEIAADYSSETARPRVPVRDRVAALLGNTQTGELVAVTEDGRVFTRPDDAASPWTQRFALPRTILP